MIKELKLFYKTKFEKEKVNFEKIYNFVDYLKKEELYPSFPVISENVNEPECIIDNKKLLMFCANDYLSLSGDEDVKEAAKNAITKYGNGPGGSRVISGNVDIIEELEREIASLVGAEDCLTLPTGYMANIGVFRATMDTFFMGMPYSKGSGVIFSDEYNHGSIVDGCKLSSAKKVVFKHNDLNDLEEKIKNNLAAHMLIVTEGVFSLDGEILDLPKYVLIAKKYGTKLMIDDAHGVGILGNRGGGTPEYHNCAKDVDIIMGCMDKAMGGTGGYLCGKKELIDYLRIATRSSILSSAIPCGMAGGVIEAVKKIKNGNKMREELFKKADYLRKGLKDNGFTILGSNKLPSIPLFVGKEQLGVEFANLLFKSGIMSPVVRWPAVPEGECRFRIIVMVNHKKEHLDKFITEATRIGKELKII